MEYSTATNKGRFATRDVLIERLSKLKIKFTEYHHPAVFNVEEAKALRGDLPGAHCKSLFLKAKGGALFLLACLEWRRMNMKVLAELLGSKRLSFGHPDLLLEKLGVTPGSVTPFSVINDDGPERTQVTVVLDEKMMQASQVNYHPLINTSTIGLTPKCLQRFLVDCGHLPLILNLETATKTNENISE